MLADLAEMNLLALQKTPARNVLVIESTEETGEGRLLGEHLKRIGVQLEHQHIPGPKIWLEIANRGLVSVKVVQSVISWISRVCP